MKILREGTTHNVKELDVSVGLEGDFETSYTTGDNSSVIPTDTIKNTVNVLAKEHLNFESERFSLLLAQHLLQKYPPVKKVTVRTEERVWDRLSVRGAPHPHSFGTARQGRPLTKVTASAETIVRQSGICDLLILKSAASGFRGFPKCELTTLPETADRIFATALTARWTWSTEPADYVAANQSINAALLQPFAENFSPSVQTTLFQMGEAALLACPEISSVHLAAPNKHCLLLDLTPFGLENQNELFLPTDQPHGQIEATVTRS